MGILLNIILAFYPATFIWYSIPAAYIKKLDSIAPYGAVHFGARALVYGLLFYITYTVMKKYIASGYYSTSRSGFVPLIFRSICVVILGSVVFFQILPGVEFYQTPQLINTYILSNPYSFFAVLIPLIYLFFD